MTASAPTTSPTGDLQGTVAHLLVPLFAEGGNDDATAFQIAHTTLDAYQPQSGADYVNVARTLAFSMTALNLLRDIAKADLSMPEKLRLFGRANALNRSADQSERTMMQRRRLQQSAKADEWLAKPSAPPPDPTKPNAPSVKISPPPRPSPSQNPPNRRPRPRRRPNSRSVFRVCPKAARRRQTQTRPEVARIVSPTSSTRPPQAFPQHPPQPHARDTHHDILTRFACDRRIQVLP